MNTELFQCASTLSPRLAWLGEHDLIVRDYVGTHQYGTGRWVCANRAMTRYACASTQDAAEQRYCELFGLTWWKLADWNGAMESSAAANDAAFEEACSGLDNW